MTKKTGRLKLKRRKTIGVLIARLGRAWGREFMAGVADAAIQRDINLFCFVGGKLNPEMGASNGIYDLITPDRFDGLILHPDLGQGVSPKRIREFCDRFAPIPIVARAMEIEGIPSLLPDNLGGMRLAIEHLLEKHGCTRIAFIRGPVGHLEADLRYQAYVEVLKANDIPVNPDLVAPGDFTPESGRAAIHTLLDQRQMKFNAVVSANDRMAFGALEALQSRGLQVPHDIALSGFDDIFEARVMGVPLTTVRQSLYTAGQQAVETLFRRIKKESTPERIIVPTELVVRWSCGCLPEALKHANANIEGAVAPIELKQLKAQREAATVMLVEAIGVASDLDAAWGAYTSPAMLETMLSQVWDAFVGELEGTAQAGAFLAAFDQALQYLQIIRRDASIWHEILSTMRRHILPGLPNSQITLKAENLFQQGRILIGEAAQRAQAYHRFAVEQHEELLQHLGQSMASVLRLEELPPAFIQHFPSLGIERFFISLYETLSAASSAPEASRLLFAYDKAKNAHTAAEETFPSKDLVPESWLPETQRLTFVVMPLELGEQAGGIVLIEVGPREWETYVRVRNLFSSTIFRALLIEQQAQARQEIERLLAEAKLRTAEVALAKEAAEKAALQAQLALKESEGLFAAARAILGATQLTDICQKLTTHFHNLVQSDRVYTFLVDHELRRVTLRVYEGDANVDDIGYEELDRGISGIVFRTGQPALSISPDDGIEPLETVERRRAAGIGPLIVVPLIAKGKVLGTVTALNKVGHRDFNQHDIDVLMALTAQAATAIETARLYEAGREQREFAEALRVASTILNYTLDFNDVLDQLLIQIQRVVPFDTGSVMLVEGHMARVARARGYDQYDFTPEDDRDRPLFDIDQTPTFRKIKDTGLPLIVADTASDPEWIYRPTTVKFRSWIGVPIVSQNGLIAFFSLNKIEPNYYTPRAAERLVTFAGQAALALENARLYDNLQRFNQQLEEMVSARTEELRRAYEALEKLDRAKSDFIGVASHELRTPLTILKGYSQLLVEDDTIKNSDYHKQLVDGILKGSVRMHEIVNSMLDMAKIDSRELQLSPEPLTVAYLVKDVLARFAPALKERRLAIVSEALTDLPPFEADPDGLTKVLWHVIGNAIKFTPDGGKITINGQVIEPGQADFPEGGIEILVSDTGIGIDPAFHELIFTKFYQTGKVALHSSGTTKFKGGGPGLGLAIARGIVSAHRGRIWVESPGHDEKRCPGSRFHIALPLRQKPAVDAE